MCLQKCEFKFTEQLSEEVGRVDVIDKRMDDMGRMKVEEKLRIGSKIVYRENKKCKLKLLT